MRAFGLNFGLLRESDKGKIAWFFLACTILAGLLSTWLLSITPNYTYVFFPASEAKLAQYKSPVRLPPNTIMYVHDSKAAVRTETDARMSAQAVEEAYPGINAFDKRSTAIRVIAFLASLFVVMLVLGLAFTRLVLSHALETPQANRIDA